MKKLNLQAVQKGAVMELFDEELRKVLANIEDENTVPNKERTITIKMSIKPDKTRKVADIKLQALSTLAKVKPLESFLFFDRDDDGNFCAYQDDPAQELLPGVDTENTNAFSKKAIGG